MADHKHTAGPWSVPHFAQPEVNCACGYVLTDGYNGAVCTVHCSGDGSPVETGDNPKFMEAVANARLIAAAPETAAERDRLKAINADLLAACIALDESAPIDSEWGTCGCCNKSNRHDNDCAVILARAAIAKAGGAK